jgi:hypothetical protein
MTRKKKQPDWNSCTWEGARREQMRRWGRLTLREKLQALEDMGKVATRFAKLHRRRQSQTAEPAS